VPWYHVVVSGGHRDVPRWVWFDAQPCGCPPGAKAITVSSRKGDLLLEIEAADEAQRDLWVRCRAVGALCSPSMLLG
jgi:hypothetical protein